MHTRRDFTELVVLHRRGRALESRHPVHAALVWADSGVVERFGADIVTTFRSSAKPFQLETSLEMLETSVRDSLVDEDLAIGAASHHGEPMHVERVTHLLELFGAEATELLCGLHPPVNESAWRALVRANEEPTVHHNNCSGKHAFMVGACRARGYEGDYRDTSHPLQRAIFAKLEARSGRIEGTVIDGCGVPSFVLPLEGMARAYATLGADMAAERPGLLGRIGWAMQRNPEMMSGSEAIDGSMIASATRPLVAKVGAEGLFCVALPEERAGLAIKVTSANADARAVAAGALVKRLFP
ncbi:MAG: asparaginase, partial [Polyangiaceae bacterium]|nr:asparaginase [Polyangiaceae bacterium]